jgi:hypothetical protein
MLNENLKVGANGEVVHTPIMSERERFSKIKEIREMIDDPDAPLAPIKRRIAAEIATATAEMITYSTDIADNALDALRVKALESQVKALRELGKELLESDVLSKKDFLNFDGPKLSFVLGEYMQGAVETLKKIGIDDGTTQQFLRQWRDLMLEREPSIRKATAKVELDAGVNHDE